jgi:hypothetical protein
MSASWGEKELEHETIVLEGKRGGSNIGLSDQLRAEFVPVKNLRFEVGLPVAYYDVAEVPVFNNLHRGGFDGIVASTRYKLLDRERSPISLTLGFEPHWARIDENTGGRVVNYGSEASIAVAMIATGSHVGARAAMRKPNTAKRGLPLPSHGSLLTRDLGS